MSCWDRRTPEAKTARLLRSTRESRQTLLPGLNLGTGYALMESTGTAMPASSQSLRRPLQGWRRDLRGAREVVRSLVSTDHPLLAHIIPMRRCNLACKYCNEYDDVSKPVPLETMFQRADKLAELKTSVITISGGEPLLHPELDDIIGRIRGNGMVAGMITNG